jgi:hypothetical protein
LQVTPFPVTGGSGAATEELADRAESAVEAFTPEATTVMTATSAIACAFLNVRNLYPTISHHRSRSVRKRACSEAVFVEMFIEQARLSSPTPCHLLSIAIGRRFVTPYAPVNILRFRAISSAYEHGEGSQEVTPQLRR